ncbi:MAG: substrate-binding domain-containing protein [Chloroflexi bacterium]|nr:substrate-binding domain-containing protein [Chloroflexota bacterium]
MSHKNLWTIILYGLVFVLGVSLAGCTAPTPTPSASGSTQTEETAVTPRIALLIPEGPLFFQNLQNGAAEAANRLGVELITRDAVNDIATQNQQIQEMIDLGVNAIIITPVDSTAVVPQIEAAAAAGIAILSVDRSIASDVVTCHIASDNLSGGKMAGDYLAEAIGQQGSVVELEGIVGTSAAKERGAGFNQAMSAYANITVAARQVADFNREVGQTVFAQILADNPDIDGVFAHNDEMILGAILAAEEAGRAGDIIFVGFDAVDDAVAALESGSLAATIAQQPSEMGRLGVENAVKHLQGRVIPKAIAVDLAMITR